MRKTRTLLTSAFGGDLAGIVLNYMMASPPERDWQSVAEAGEWETCSDEHADVDECLCGAFSGNHLELSKSLLARGGQMSWDHVLYYSCMNGWHGMAELAISRGADDLDQDAWDFGLGAACTTGQYEMAELMITHGANDFDWGLSCACDGGQYHMAEMMIMYGASDWDRAFTSAHHAGHADLIQLITFQKDTKTCFVLGGGLRG